MSTPAEHFDMERFRALLVRFCSFGILVWVCFIWLQDDPKKAPAYKLAIQNYKKSSQKNISFDSVMLKQVSKNILKFVHTYLFLPDKMFG